MNGAALAPGLVFAALGLMLSFAASTRVMLVGAAVALVTAFTAILIPVPAVSAETALTGCWLSVILAAIASFWPRPLRAPALIPLCAAGGLAAGATSATAGAPSDLALAALWLLLAVPGALLVRRGWGLAPKVAASWLAAAALLSLGLNMVPTLGYQSDHIE